MPGELYSKMLLDGLGPVHLEFVSYSDIPVSIPGSSPAELHGALTFEGLTLNGVMISEP
ncbi:MAG: hypothetical protein ACYCWK_01645 [Cuniculiplasma sp.]